MSSQHEQPYEKTSARAHPLKGKFAGIRAFMREQKEHPIGRTQHWAVDGRQRRSAAVAENMNAFVVGEKRKGSKDRTIPADMVRFALGQLIFESGMSIKQGDDGIHRLGRELTPDQVRPNFNKRILNNTALRVIGRHVTEASMQRDMEATVHRGLDRLTEGIDKDKWGEQINPIAVKALRDVWVQERVDESGAGPTDTQIRRSASKHINNAGMEMVMRTPDIFSDYFAVDYGEYLEKGAEVVPDRVYAYVDTLLRLPDAQLDVLADIETRRP
jgi:hypothetical protein